MSVVRWLRDILPLRRNEPPAFNNEKYQEARRLIGDVIGQATELNTTIQKRAHDPFVSIPRDLRRQRELSEYDQAQASDIYEKMHHERER